MARIVLISPYLKGGQNAAKLAQRTRYVATRPGVELLADERSTLPATKKQQDFITRLLKSFPSCWELIEYEEYLDHPTQGSASAFIQQVREDYMEALEQKENFIDYISHRPGVQKDGEHGLWDAHGKVQNLAQAVREVAEHPGNTDLVSLLRAQGERPVRSGREFRTPNDPSITVRGNKWFDHSKREGGYAVSFVQRYYRLPYQEAVLLLLGRKNGKSYEQAKPAKEASKPFALPEPYGTMRRMYAYLMRQRHIDREVISYFVHEKLLYEDKHHNCVFVGVDGSGEAKHAHIRSTNSEGRVFRMNIESSASEHCFHKDGTDKSLYVFEAPIDLLSHITLNPYGWQEHSYVACCGTSIQPVLERLRQNPKLDTVYLCLDNDDAGNDACDRMTDTLEDMGLEVERLCPVRKDWNDDLCVKFERKEN